METAGFLLQNQPEQEIVHKGCAVLQVYENCFVYYGEGR